MAEAIRDHGRPTTDDRRLLDGSRQSSIINRQSPIQWPTATSFRGSPIQLSALLEAEFNATQLRDLAKWLDVRLKGNSKTGLLEQAAAALHERAGQIAIRPEALLDGLTPEQQDFVRRLLTARDHELPIPRNTAAQLWSRQSERSDRNIDRESEHRLAEMIDSLRRRALLFPTHALFPNSYRDVYYRWLPLRGSVPVLNWKLEAKSEKDVAHFSLLTSNFLDAFESFLDAILSSGVTIRPPLTPHQQAGRLSWLKDWEHDADEAERLLRSRPNWLPDPMSGLSTPMPSPFTAESAANLENQTGLSAAQCEFLFAIACAMQLIQAPSQSAPGLQHLRARASAIEEWLVMTSAQKLQRAWKAWSEEIIAPLEARNAAASVRSTQAFRVMRAIGARDLTPSLLAAEWCALRRYVARVLRGVPVGQWFAWDDLRQALFEFYPDCAWTFATRADWWFASAQGSGAGGMRLDPLRSDEWAISIGRIIEHILRDSLCWFGAVEVALDADNVRESGALEAFRVTDVGAWLTGSRPGAMPVTAVPNQRAVEPIEWLDQQTLRVPPAPDRSAFIGLVRLAADPSSLALSGVEGRSGGSGGEVPFTYTFTPASIERALTHGVTMDDVMARFKEMGVPLPKHIADEFKSIAKRFGRIRVYEALTVLELVDDYAAKELAASTSLMRHVVYRISPRAFVVHDEAVDGLIAEMQAKGYTPRVK
jgi:hypothetical protein